MGPRRVALVLAVALAAAGSTIGASAARASSTICVALVVDARTLGSDVSTSCATVSKGATGVDVLRAGGHTVGFRNDGLICTIDGLPKNGCAAVDDSHYWAYFHRAPAKTTWTYSTEGASTYRPVNASTEGWVWDNGKALTPKNVPYAQICKTKPSPKASQRPGQSKPTASHQPSHGTASSRSHATPTPTPASSTSAAPRQRRRGHRHRHRHHRTVATSTPTSPTNPRSPPSASPTAVALVGGAEPPRSHHGGLDLLIGLAIVAALGGLAALRFRRSAR